MGKKDRMGGGNKRSVAAGGNVSDDEVDHELETEMRVLEAIRAEKAAMAEGGVAGGAGTGSKETRQRGMYNKEGLEQALANRTELPFLESYELCEFGIEALVDENDDLAREMAFYNQTMIAVTTGRDTLRKLGVPLRRPDDYFAENVKSDAHMMRIKDKLLLETKKMDAFEKRQQRETNRKYNKQLQEMKKKERSDRTKSDIEDFTALRKRGASSDEVDEKVERLLGKGDKEGRGGARGVGERGKTEKSLKRKNMDKKYGAGTKEKMKNKLNDKKSYNDMSDYNPRGGKMVRRDRGSGKPGGGGSGGKAGGKGGKGGAYKASGAKNGKSGRPGKSKRDAKR